LYRPLQRHAFLQVLHFVGHRKKALPLVHKAFMQGSQQGAYRMLSKLPHTEEDYAALDITGLQQYLPLSDGTLSSS